MPTTNKPPSQHPVIKQLIAGNKNWVTAKKLKLRPQIVEETINYIDNQDPSAVIITCADSRVIPEFIFDTGVSDLFVIRVAGNVITEEVAASVEFAVVELKTEVVLILGHQNCGAVIGKLNMRNQPINGNSNLPRLFSRMKVVEDGNDNNIERSVEINCQTQREQLLEISPICSEKEKSDEIEIVSAVYQLDTREVKWLID